MNTHIIRQYLQNVSNTIFKFRREGQVQLDTSIRIKGVFNTIFKFRREGQVQLDIRIKGVSEQMHYYQLSNMQITLTSHDRLIKRKKYGETSPDLK